MIESSQPSSLPTRKPGNNLSPGLEAGADMTEHLLPPVAAVPEVEHAWAPPPPDAVGADLPAPVGPTAASGNSELTQLQADNQKFAELKQANRGIFGNPGEGEAVESIPVRILGIRDIPDLVRSRNELEKQKETDALTGLRNELGLRREMKQRITAAETGGDSEFALLYLDFDGFKKLNDKHGHAAGDQLLIRFGQYLRGELKLDNEEPFKFRGGEEIFRLHGDEFVALIHTKNNNERRNPTAAKEEVAQGYVERLDGAIRRIGKAIHKRIKVSGSFGDAYYEADDTVDTMLDRADKRMYQAKRVKKSNFSKVRGHVPGRSARRQPKRLAA